MVKRGGEREEDTKKERDRDARFKRFIDESEAGASGSTGVYPAGTENAAAGTAGGFAAARADLLLSKRTGEAAGDHSETRTGAATGQEAVLVGGTEDFAA